MITETSEKKQLLTAINEPLSRLLELIVALNENKVNIVPYKDSWTAGELLRHVTKSTDAIAKAMKQKGTQAQRNAGEKISELKKVFLNFSHKMNSPQFIVPEKFSYEKETSSKELKEVFEKLTENTNYADLNEVVEGLPMGEVTKLELLHFVLYHTQRHLHQMQKISEALKDK